MQEASVGMEHNPGFMDMMQSMMSDMQNGKAAGLQDMMSQFMDNKAQAQSMSRDPYELTQFLIDKINNSRAS